MNLNIWESLWTVRTWESDPKEEGSWGGEPTFCSHFFLFPQSIHQFWAWVKQESEDLGKSPGRGVTVKGRENTRALAVTQGYGYKNKCHDLGGKRGHLSPILIWFYLQIFTEFWNYMIHKVMKQNRKLQESKAKILKVLYWRDKG